MRRVSFLPLLGLLLLGLLTTKAHPVAAAAPAAGWVTDLAGVLGPEEERRISDLCARVEQASGVEIAVVAVPSLGGSDIESYAVALFQKMGIGKKGSDNGLLILAAIEEKTGRIEVGYGLEGVLPDALAGRILREVIFPSFREGGYGEGFYKGTAAVAGILSEKLDFTLEGVTPLRVADGAAARPSVPAWIAWPLRILIGIGLVILFIKNPFLFFLVLGMGRGGGVGGRGFGGGFGGFGGGLSGGGGASGRW